jgi:DNA (cytosine-5)-methyltransferase 1
LLSGGKTALGTASRIGKFIDDPRNYLFKWFVQVAAMPKPAVILIENVPDLIRHKDGETREEVLQALSDAGYRATARVLNSADYGVPQMRRRAFFLGQRKDDFAETSLNLDFPTPTHRPYPLLHSSLNEREDWLPGDAGYWPSVREAIGDLPAAFEDDDFEHAAFRYPNAPMSALRRFLRTPDGAAPYNHIGRVLGKNGMKRVKLMGAGDRATSLPENLRPRAHYHNSYARLQWAEPARTITKFVYHVGSGMFTHPSLNRAITMREAARLQTFPDWFRFHAPQIRQLSALVGSAVPPLLAQRMAQQIVGYLDNLTYAKLRPDLRAGVRTQATDAVLKRMEREEWSSYAEKNQLSLTIPS